VTQSRFLSIYITSDNCGVHFEKCPELVFLIYNENYAKLLGLEKIMIF